MKGPGRGHVRDTTALPWERTVTIFAITTTQRKLVACCLSNKVHLCVHPSQLETQRGFHVSALLCQTTPATIRRHSTALLCHHRSHRSHRHHRSHQLGANPNPSQPCHAKHLLSVNLRLYGTLRQLVLHELEFCAPIADFWILLFLLGQVREYTLH